jgi:hypothetical protein
MSSRHRIALLAACLGALLASSATFAMSCDAVAKASSGPSTTTIAELYTSEGCDSCPPADKWFSSLSPENGAVVPLAFHVGYWDYIGWRDRFAKPAFADRQRSAVSRRGSRTVYTPQVMLDGKDVRSWSLNEGFQSVVREVAGRPARASLNLEAAAGTDLLSLGLKVNVPDAALRHESALFLAVTENHLMSRVTAGENKGTTLRHDHVVRELIGPIALRVDGPLDIRRIVPMADDWKRRDLAVVAFVQDQRNGEVLQALSTPLCPM